MADGIEERVAASMAELTLEQKVGQLFVTCLFGADATRPAAEDERHNLAAFGLPTPADIVRKFHLGGVLYADWAHNTQHPEQVAQLSNGLQSVAVDDASGIPLFLAAGQERGTGEPLCATCTQLPGAMALGACGNDRDAYQAALVAGRELTAMGVNQVHAPVVDVAANPKNPVVGVRSFGADPELVARLAAATVRGCADAGISTVAKHFPGHGDTTVDNRTGVPVLDRDREEWQRLDAAPFRAVVTEGVEAVLAAHVAVPALDESGRPATLSAPILTELLRDELGHDGPILVDSLRMRGLRAMYGDEQLPVLALSAGADQLLVPPNLELAIGAVLDAVRQGTLTEDRIDESVARILRLKLARGLFDAPYVDTDEVAAAIGGADHNEGAARIADRTVTLVRDDAGAVPLDPSWQAVLVVGVGESATAALAEELGSYASWTVGVDTGAAPDEEAIKSAVARAKHHDVVVLLTNRAWDTTITDPNAGQRHLLAALLETGTRVVVVATNDPHDLVYAERAETCLATYGDAEVSMRALARVLIGAVEPRGRLPLELPWTS